MAEVKFENITKKYGDLTAISEMAWTANQGEFIVIFGPSGAGKTTTLEMIAGLVKPNEGEIYFDGQAMKDVDTSDRNVSMTFENYALYPHMSVFENIAFPLKIPERRAEFSTEEVKRRVVEIAEVLQIEMLLDRQPKQLSGGQRQRVALGRCLIREPEVCLLDEPIAHLDAKLRHRMYAELKRIQRERGTTTIYATPAQSEAMAMADRIVILFEGKVQQVASPRELYERPGSVEVAKFGGEQPMNILPITLGQENQNHFFTYQEQRVSAPQNLIKMIGEESVATESLLGVRPADIKLEFKESKECCLSATLYAVEQLGRTARVTVKIGEQMIEVATKAEIDSAIGDTIWLSLSESPLYLFDVTTNKLVAASNVKSVSK